MFTTSLYGAKRKREAPSSQRKRDVSFSTFRRLCSFTKDVKGINIDQSQTIPKGEAAAESLSWYTRLFDSKGMSYNIKPKEPTVSREEVRNVSDKVRSEVLAAENRKLDQYRITQDEEQRLLERVKQDMANQHNEPQSVQIGEESDDEMEVENDQTALLIASRKSDISPNEIDSIKEIFRKGSNCKDIVIDKFNIDITVSKLCCLKPNTWLNDEAVNFYMEMLKERDSKLCKDSNGLRTPSHYFNSFFISKLLENGYTYSNVRRWSKKFDVFAMDRIFMPVNLNNTHWVMAVVFIKKKEIHYYDSMSGQGQRHLKAILRWLADESQDKKNAPLDTSEWTLFDQEETVPQQRNGYDCGVFSIICADYVSDNLPFEYSQGEMSDNRLKIAAAIKRGFIAY